MPHRYAKGEVKEKENPAKTKGSLKEGEVVKAKVVSSDNGITTLKIGNEQVEAKIITAALVAPGDTLTLQVTGRENGMPTMVVVQEGEVSPPPEPEYMREFNDKSLAPYAKVLDELGLPVRESTAAFMKITIELDESWMNNLHDRITLRQAAFLASNKLQGTLIPPALTLAAGAKTGKMLTALQNILQSLGEPAAPAENQQDMSQPPEAVAAKPTQAPIADLMTMLKSLMPVNSTIIPQANGTLQHEIITYDGDNSQNAVKNATTGGTSAAEPAKTQGGAEAVQTQPGSGTAQSVVSGQNSPVEQLSRTIAETMSALPEFQGTPISALEKFSNTLLRVAMTMPAAEGDAKLLAELLEQAFAGVERTDENLGERLNQAKDELFLRLALVEEELSKSAGADKALEQTHKLIDHVRVVNNIEQFVYMQIPLKNGEEEQTAELYVFKQKGGGKRIDPENVNVLLALDLRHMGHWEGLINIRGKDVSVKMQVPGQAEKDFLGSNTVLLHEILKEAGFNLASTSIVFSEEKTTPVTAMLVPERLLASAGRGINFTI